MRRDSHSARLRAKGSRKFTLEGKLIGRYRHAAAAIILVLAIGLMAEDRPSEADVRAAYLLNFGKFIRLTTPTSHPTFDICFLGDDLVGQSLDRIVRGEQIGNRAARVLRTSNTAQLRTCDVVYIGSSERSRIETYLEALKGADVLTVSDDPDFLKKGGMIQFLLVQSHVRFAVNLEPVKRTHLVLSSELLRVATSISGGSVAEGKQ